MNLFSSLNKPWAISEPEMKSFIQLIKSENFQNLPQLTVTKTFTTPAGFRVIPVRGVLSKYSSWLEEYGYGTSYESIIRQVRSAVEDTTVLSIIFHADSPGGEVDGLVECTDFVKAMDERKPIYTHVSGTCASAMYWLATGTRKIFATRGSYIGSIGCIATVYDYSRMFQDIGIDEFDFVSSISPDKIADPATDSGKALRQSHVDECASIFVDTIVENRYVVKDDIITKYGKGDVLLASKSLVVGMIDDILTFPEVIGKLEEGGGMLVTAQDEIDKDENTDEIEGEEDENKEKKARSQTDEEETDAQEDEETDEEETDAQEDEETDEEEPDAQEDEEEMDKKTEALIRTSPVEAQKLIDYGASRERKRIAELDEVAKAYPFHKNLLAKAKLSGMNAGDFLIAAVRSDKRKAKEDIINRNADAAKMKTLPDSKPDAVADNFERRALEHAKSLNGKRV